MILDISHYQGTIDWDTLRPQIDFLIMRASVGSNADKKFPSYATDCGCPYGVYHYVKAGTAADAETEAEFFYGIASQYNPLFYVADIEYETQTKTTTKTVYEAFINKLKALGAQKTGVYIGQSRYPYISDNLSLVDFVWIPRYGKNTGKADSNYKPKYPCDLWQYTSEGYADGISGHVDMNQLNGDKTLEWFLETSSSSSTNTDSENGGTSEMADKFTAAHFVEYCEKWVGHPYWYGCVGYKCTQDLYEHKQKQYPSHYTSSRASKYKKHIEAKEICTDCVGLLKSYFWTNGGETVFEAYGTDNKITNKYKSNDMPDKSADGMFTYAKSLGMDNGTVATIPDTPGIAVRYSGHVGVYVGDGYCVEARGFNYGVVKTKLKDRAWTHWYKIPGITYGESTSDTTTDTTTYKLGDRVLKKGMEGDDVTELQTIYVQTLQYDLGDYGTNKDGIDGEYGSKTVEATKTFQESQGLTVDGIYGEDTHKALMAAIADSEPDPEPEPTEPTQTGKTIVVTGNSVRVRSGDSTKYAILTTAHKDDTFTAVLDKNGEALQSENGWYAIARDSEIAWISGKYSKVG